MTTPIVMLLLLATPWLCARTRAAGAIGLGLPFLFTGVGHFTETDAMAQMLPPWVPAGVVLVYVTGVLELGLGVAFFVPSLRRCAGLAAVLLLIAFLPVNVYAAIERVPMGGHAWPARAHPAAGDPAHVGVVVHAAAAGTGGSARAAADRSRPLSTPLRSARRRVSSAPSSLACPRPPPPPPPHRPWPSLRSSRSCSSGRRITSCGATRCAR